MTFTIQRDFLTLKPKPWNLWSFEDFWYRYTRPYAAYEGGIHFFSVRWLWWDFTLYPSLRFEECLFDQFYDLT